jgi:ATP-dependent Clp protease ATP-binding subunit ClpA
MLATMAPQLAATLGHPYIGTEHLLLAIVAADADDGASALLEAVGASKQAVRNALADELEVVIEQTVRGVPKN